MAACASRAAAWQAAATSSAGSADAARKLCRATSAADASALRSAVAIAACSPGRNPRRTRSAATSRMRSCGNRTAPASGTSSPSSTPVRAPPPDPRVGDPRGPEIRDDRLQQWPRNMPADRAQIASTSRVGRGSRTSRRSRVACTVSGTEDPVGAGELPHEERVAAGPPVHPGGHLGRHGIASHRQQLTHLGGGQAGQLVGDRDPGQVGEQHTQRARRPRVDRAVGADQGDRRPAQLPARNANRRRLPASAHCRSSSTTTVGSTRPESESRTCGEHPEPGIARVGRRVGESGGDRSGGCAKSPENLLPRPERRRAVGVPAGRPGAARPAGDPMVQGIARQRRFADPGFTAQQNDRPASPPITSSTVPRRAATIQAPGRRCGSPGR